MRGERGGDNPAVANPIYSVYITPRDISEKGGWDMTEKVSLDGLSYAELQTLISAAQEKAEQKRHSDLAEAVEAVKADLAKRGFTLAELIAYASAQPASGGKIGRKKQGEGAPRKKVEPKYRDPENPENTWTGRGIKPKWLAAKLEGGAKLEEFIIKE